MYGRRRSAVQFSVWALVALLAGVAAASAQDSEAIKELKKLHEELCQPHRVMTLEAGEGALDKLAKWNLSPEGLSEGDRSVLLSTEIYAGLAVGDAKHAAEVLARLQKLAPTARETLEAGYLVAAATGNADAGHAALKQLADVVTGDDGRVIAQQRRWVKRLGTEAPAIELVPEGGTRLSAKEHSGVVLVIDFWTRRDATKEYAAALKALREAYQHEPHVQFYGVNADDKADVDAAREFARTAGYSWPQVYEEKSIRPPITFGAFQAGSPPWTVVIDAGGRIRMAGLVTEPAFVYALRAAEAEVSGRLTKPKAAVSPTNSAKPAEKAQPNQGPLPSNEEAASLLREARTYMKTGMKTKAREVLEKIVREYPGTIQAKDAKELLDLLH